jgi:hypothetical protein
MITMFGFAFYIGGCLVLAAVITLIYSMMRPIHSKGDSKSWKVLFLAFVMCITAPYGYVEVLTQAVGGPMKAAVQEGFSESGINGEMRYYRVVSYGNNSARVIAVAKETQDWGGTDRPIVAITLKKDAKGWKPDSFNVVYSDRLNKDRSTLPPYW